MLSFKRWLEENVGDYSDNLEFEGDIIAPMSLNFQSLRRE